MSISAGALQRVLIVDDSRAQLVVLSQMLRPLGLQIETATTAEDAAGLIDRFDPDLILSDWMMPGKSGLEFCRDLRARDIGRYRYVILLTSKTAKEEIAAGLDAGADDFISKPVNGDELRARVNAGARILSMQRELKHKNDVISTTLAELQKHHDAVEKDLKQARIIQKSLVPKGFHDFGGASISLLLEPCGHVGGDLVGVFAANDTSIGFYNIDVSGHGIAAALISARVASYFSAAYPRQNIALDHVADRFILRAPGEICRDLNTRMSADPAVTEYLTMVFGTLDLGTGTLRLVQAGHPPPLLISGSGKTSFLGEGGLPVGLIPDADYIEIAVSMTPGDRLLLYSDGFSETRLPTGGLLEEVGLADLVASVPATSKGEEYLNDLYWRLCAARGMGHEGDDDISALLLEMR